MDRRRKIGLQIALVQVIVRREAQRLDAAALERVRTEALRIVAGLEEAAAGDDQLLDEIRAAREELG